MPTIEYRPAPDGKPVYRVKVRLKGHPTQSATFVRLTDAKRWAQSTEAAVREGRHFKDVAARKHTLAELIDRYIDEILPLKPRNARTQKAQLKFWKQSLGHLNLPIAAPTSFDINTSIQRALVKAIALHGLGLYIYAGEDLPQGGKEAGKPPTQPKASVTAHPTAKPASAAQIGFIEKLIRETGSDTAKVLSFFRVNALSELTAQAASRAITSLQGQRSAA